MTHKSYRGQSVHSGSLFATSQSTHCLQLAVARSVMLSLLALTGCNDLGSGITITSALDSDKTAVETYINNEYQGQDPKILKWYPKTPIKQATFVRPNGEKYHMGFDTREEAIEMIRQREKVTGEKVTLEVFEQVGTTISVEFQFTKDEQNYFHYSKLHVVDGAVTGSSMAVTVGFDYERFQERVIEAEREWEELMNEE